jgi:hypothetical protein
MGTGRISMGADFQPVAGVTTYRQPNDAYWGNGAVDSTEAIQGALDSGLNVQLPTGHIRISKPLRMRRKSKFMGQGMEATLLYLDQADAPGIVCEEGVADRATISDLTIRTFTPVANQHGIVVRAALHNIERVGVFGVGGHGIQIGEGGANSQGWGLSHVSIGSCGGDGVHVFYGNAGSAFRVSVLGGQGRGICDESNLGNNYFGCHVEAVVGACYKGGGDPAIPSTGVQRTAFWGCYAEGPRCELYPPAVWFGGYPSGGFNPEALSGGCLIFIDSLTSHAHRMRTGTASGQADLLLGSHDGKSSPLGWASPIPFTSENYRLLWNQPAKEWVVSRGATTADTDVAFGHTAFGHERPWSHLVAPQLLVGSARVRVTSGPAAPVAGTWKRGDRHLHSDPAPGEPKQWVCVTQGGWPTSVRTDNAVYGRYATIAPVAGHLWICDVDSGRVANSATAFTPGQDQVDGAVTWKYWGVVPPVFEE